MAALAAHERRLGAFTQMSLVLLNEQSLRKVLSAVCRYSPPFPRILNSATHSMAFAVMVCQVGPRQRPGLICHTRENSVFVLTPLAGLSYHSLAPSLLLALGLKSLSSIFAQHAV